MNILETDRLLLRRLVPEDFDALYALYRDEEMRRYFPEGVLSEEETREELDWFLGGHPRHPELGLWATIEKATGRFIGRCGLLPWTLDGREEVEIAYMIDKVEWGKGYGGEAALAIRDYAVARLGLKRLICFIDSGNGASMRVAEKVGMHFERASEDETGPFLIYSMEVEG